MKRLDPVTVYFAHCPRFGAIQHYRLHKRGVYCELGRETKSLLTPDVVKLSHDGTSDAQASVHLWVGVAIGAMSEPKYVNLDTVSIA